MHASGSKRKREKGIAPIAQAAQSSGDGGSSGSVVSPPASKRARTGSSSSPAPSSRGSASSSSSLSSAAAALSKALVKMGSGGTWGVFEPDDDVLDMHRMKLLKALKADEIFGGDFEGVKKMSACAVLIRKGKLPAGQKVPTAAEEVDASKFVELEADMTVRDAAVVGRCKGERLFIFVRLPAVAASSSAASSSAAAEIAPPGLNVLRDPSTGAADVLAAMDPQWKELVKRLKDTRARLSKKAVPMLHRPTAPISLKAAPKLGMTTLLKDEGSETVRLGTFTLPPVPADILDGPKGLPLNKEQQWFHLEQRAEISRQFLDAVRAGSSGRFGVLLSGPNGTGKSAIGVEAALSSFARGLVCVYISPASAWIEAAKYGNGDGFLLELLLRQNVDLIAAQPALREALAPALVMGPAAVGKLDATAAGSVMKALRATLKANPALGVGIIVDEVQTISAAVGEGMSSKALETQRTAAVYFKAWHNWDNHNDVFVRMDIASNHGLRELNLPPGERHRLRIIMPWAADVVTAASTAAGSPCAFPKAHESARQRIVYAAGGIPRLLFEGKAILDDSLAAGDSLKAAAAFAASTIEHYMKDDCTRWLDELGSVERQKAAAKLMLRLVRGEVEWDAVKGLYDRGIVARYDRASYKVKPVSSVAASVVMAQLAPHYRKGEFTPLRDVTADEQRGYELETQVVTLLEDGRNVLLPAKTLDGKTAAFQVPACLGERVPFGTASEVVAHPSDARLFVPTDTCFACDAITVPPASAAASEPIVVWETSVTSPQDPERVKKVCKWFLEAGIVKALRAAHPGRPIVCALCWPDNLVGAGKKDAYKELMKPAARVRTAVVDRAGLQLLGVLA